MTMHLIRGVYAPKSKKKANRKPGWQKAEQEHREWLMKHGINPDVKSKRKKEFVPYESKDSSYVRQTPHYPSLEMSNVPGSGTKKEPMVYSGDYIVGIATMHKSNLVPVGRGDNPKDYATMRRN